MTNNQPAAHQNGNGDSTAPPGKSGAFFVPLPGSAERNGGAPQGSHPPPTRFPPELHGVGSGGLLYTLGRAQIIAFPPATWIVAAGVAAALLLALQPGMWPWIGAALLVAALVLRLLVWRVVRSGGVRFVPSADADLLGGAGEPLALPAQSKLPVYVSGCLEVGNRVQRFALLPGFYRTFATREHALLCLRQGGKRLLVAEWPDAEVGLWYAFFKPQQLRALQVGTLHHGRLALTALALEVDATPTRGRVRRRAVETLYLAGEAADLARIARDLTLDAAVAGLDELAAAHQQRTAARQPSPPPQP